MVEVLRLLVGAGIHKDTEIKEGEKAARRSINKNEEISLYYFLFSLIPVSLRVNIIRVKVLNTCPSTTPLLPLLLPGCLLPLAARLWLRHQALNQ